MFKCYNHKYSSQQIKTLVYIVCWSYWTYSKVILPKCVSSRTGSLEEASRFLWHINILSLRWSHLRCIWCTSWGWWRYWRRRVRSKPCSSIKLSTCDRRCCLWIRCRWWTLKENLLSRLLLNTYSCLKLKTVLTFSFKNFCH